MSSQRTNQYLENQTREFTDSAGGRWRARVEQDGGRATSGGPPTAQLIFTPSDDPEADDISASGDPGNWDLSSYADERLRALLTQAQSHAANPRAE